MDYTDNPLHVEIVPTLVPIANEVLEEVRLEVNAEEVVEPKIEQCQTTESCINKKCENILDYMYIGILILIFLGIIGGFILFLVWMNNPHLFGTNPI